MVRDDSSDPSAPEASDSTGRRERNQGGGSAAIFRRRRTITSADGLSAVTIPPGWQTTTKCALWGQLARSTSAISARPWPAPEASALGARQKRIVPARLPEAKACPSSAWLDELVVPLRSPYGRERVPHAVRGPRRGRARGPQTGLAAAGGRRRHPHGRLLHSREAVKDVCRVAPAAEPVLPRPVTRFLGFPPERNASLRSSRTLGAPSVPAS
jgi:hypothetical protein